MNLLNQLLQVTKNLAGLGQAKLMALAAAAVVTIGLILAAAAVAVAAPPADDRGFDPTGVWTASTARWS